MLRDRSFSDAHDLVYSTRNARHGGSDDVPVSGILSTNVDSVINQVGVASISKRTTACVNNRKHHASSHQHHQSHGNGRPRSKSLDVHRHSTAPVHKKKYTLHQHSHPRAHSPGGGGYQHHGGNAGSMDAFVVIADNPATPKRLQGKMWIRPAVSASSPVPFVFPTPTNANSSAAWSPVHSVHQATIEDGSGFATGISPTSALKDSPIRQVTDASFLSSPDPSFDDEMILTPFATPHDPCSSFDPYRQMQGRGIATRIIFGESGKPIRPRTAYSGQFAPI